MGRVCLLARSALSCLCLVLTLALAVSAFVHALSTPLHRLPPIALEILNGRSRCEPVSGARMTPPSKSSKEAQAFYDQGLAYLHSYIWIEAARSFTSR